MTPLLEINRISKKMGNLTALRRVSLTVAPQEVVGVADRGEVGKMALFRILGGALAPDKGEVALNGRWLQWPFHAQPLGINMLYPEPALVDGLDVTSNIFLGNELGWPILDNWLRVPNQRRMDEEAQKLLASLDVRLPSLRLKAANLSNEQRQLVAIAQLLVRPSKLIMVDNPGRVLSHPYQEKLLGLIREWQQRETAVLFSSNNLDHLFAVADRIIVLRQGNLVANLRTDETSREEVVAALVGTDDRQQHTPVLWALDSYYRARKQAETLQHNQMLLQRDLAAQDSLNRQLLNQLSDQVKALDSANNALQDAQRRLLTEREEERKYLARELHDQIMQDLLSLNYQLEEIEDKAAQSLEIIDDVVDIRSSIRELVEELRRVCGNLRPPTIDSLGLGAALQSLTRNWSERTGIVVDLTLDANFGRLPEPIELSIFRIVQEGLNNIWKHANATQVQISLTHTSPRLLLISIADNGTGLTEPSDLASLSNAGHYGLLGISERVALMGGRLNFHNQRSSGLLLQVEIPHPRFEKRPL
ncbi:MAG: ATP-binding cassette domain-containing protein [Ardenticatenaceae bacterium]|nr:ATP-binding cassette domain-containing protein [Ardenticatenaceae bacterium]